MARNHVKLRVIRAAGELRRDTCPARSLARTLLHLRKERFCRSSVRPSVCRGVRQRILARALSRNEVPQVRRLALPPVQNSAVMAAAAATSKAKGRKKEMRERGRRRRRRRQRRQREKGNAFFTRGLSANDLGRRAARQLQPCPAAVGIAGPAPFSVGGRHEINKRSNKGFIRYCNVISVILLALLATQRSFPLGVFLFGVRHERESKTAVEVQKGDEETESIMKGRRGRGLTRCRLRRPQQQRQPRSRIYYFLPPSRWRRVRRSFSGRQDIN